MFKNPGGINVIKGELVYGILQICNIDLFPLYEHIQRKIRATYQSLQPRKMGQELDLPGQDTKILQRVQDEEVGQTLLTQQEEMVEGKSVHI